METQKETKRLKPLMTIIQEFNMCSMGGNWIVPRHRNHLKLPCIVPRMIFNFGQEIEVSKQVLNSGGIRYRDNNCIYAEEWFEE